MNFAKWPAAIRIIKVILQLYRGDGTVYSPALVAASCQPEDRELVPAFLAFLTFPPLSVLEVRWIYQAEEELPLTAAELQQAWDDDELIHPTTGDIIPQFRQRMDRVGCYYLATSRFPNLKKVLLESDP
jgi:hypothetical protein